MNTLLLGLSNPKNRELLANFLGQKYHVHCPNDLHQGLSMGFDLCILDSLALQRHEEQISLRRQFEEPRFLPMLAVVSKPQLEQTSKEKLHQLIDEVLFYPIDKVEMLFRVESLIRARILSIKLYNLLEQEKVLERQLRAANEELQKTAIQDSLTGLANRRAFDESLHYEFERARRSQTPLILMLCDVDYFKAYNDTYGHVQGDRCLKQVATILHSSVRRPPDLAARYGGEEFALILPDTSVEGTVHVAQRIRAEVHRAQITHQSSGIAGHVTLSFGIGCLVPAIADTPEAIVHKADQALYQAKALGRDRIVALSDID